MPTTRKQKKARKSRGLEKLSDKENLDILLGERRSEREESVNSNLARRPESANSNLFENNEENLYLNSGVMGSSNNAGLGQNSTSASSSAEIIRLSSNLNSRISREMDETMNSVSVQIRKTINDAISSQILPQIQNAITAGSGHVPQRGWNDPAEGPETNTEVLRNEKPKNNWKSELVQNRLNDGPIDNAYDSTTR